LGFRELMLSMRRHVSSMFILSDVSDSQLTLTESAISSITENIHDKSSVNILMVKGTDINLAWTSAQSEQSQ
jgi:hypothetical protein